MFENRSDAGRQLGRALDAYRDEDVIVLAIPRGGVEVGYQVAQHLNAEFSMLIARKLPYPNQPEAGFGAVAEDGSTVILEDAARWVSDRQIERIVERQRQEIERRVEALREGQPLPDLAGRTVILVDDGIAMGSTMRASIGCCRHQGADKIVVAVPVAGQAVAEAIGEGPDRLADEIVVLEQPEFFRAVAQVYERWYDVPDSEVRVIMERWRDEQEEI